MLKGRRYRFGSILLSGAMLPALLGGCMTKQPAASPENKPAEHQPVTISVGVKTQGYLTDEEFQRYIIAPVSKQYPWITVQKFIYNAQGTKLAELVAAGNVPDIVITNNVNGMPEFLELDLAAPLTEWIQKHKFDLAKIETQAVEAVKAATQTNDLAALPYARNFQTLYYNKDIFDKFAVPYPKDGMTWEQATELAKLVTRNDNGTQYRGLEPNVPERLASQLSLPFVDPKTNKAALNTPEWKQVMERMIAIHSIPGNEQISFNKEAAELFYKKRTLAMLADINLFGDLSQFQDLNWDMASFPVWQKLPGVSPGIDAHLMVLSKTSSKKEDAFRVMSAILSDEVQMDMSRQGRYSVLKDPKVKEAFGKDLTYMVGKNVKAVNMTPASPYPQTVYDTQGISAARAALTATVKNGKDVNTALREANETFDKKIEELKKK
ncbi:hypothetical protein PAESOLCIP111_01775 [Paenibacillus solanacearum]|uniref:Extracellular solute-binding protein n=1 Tax=Paenibacillus solanacearum TaxID=2048548 RepID=A0A916JYX8_9BACL|nr:extracellular solute-binding protein [Paenibacillus solanacearum]CAG7615059.1 hypothetical protein PAESOLCIP111_01775 [Paenibacillus solanacearum]